MPKIEIVVDNLNLTAELNDSDTANTIYDVLPIEGIVNTWGDEIYFDIPVSIAQDSNATDDVDVGMLGYWPVGKAFCIFWGPTPVSTGPKPRAASPVNIIGKMIDDATQLGSVSSGAKVILKKVR